MTIKEFEALEGEIRILEDGLELWRKIEHDSRHDKKGLGFSINSNHAAIKFSLSLDSWRGTYGDSSVYDVFRHLGELFPRYFTSFLNKQAVAIIGSVLEMMRADLAKNAGQKIAELKAELDRYEAMKGSGD